MANNVCNVIASKLVINFDSLQLLNTIKSDNEATAVSLIKTTLEKTARNLANDESAIISKLSAMVMKNYVTLKYGYAKIMNTRQNNKTANTAVKLKT